MTNKVKPLTTKQAIALHGDTGSLIIRLVKYNRFLMAITTISLIGLIVVSTMFILLPRTILTIDQAGNIVGDVHTYNDGTLREQSEVQSASLRFAECFLNHNAQTAFEDKYCALSMMSPTLYTHWRDIWLKTNTIKTIKSAGYRCIVLIDDEKRVFKKTKTNRYYTSLTGTVKCNNLDKTMVENYILEFSASPTKRTAKNTGGIIIESLFETPYTPTDTENEQS